MAFWLQAAGLILGVYGVFMMSLSYYSTSRFWHMPKKLLMALFSIRRAKLTTELAELNGQQQGRAFQGLAIVLIGFILQFIGLIISAIPPDFFNT